MRGIRGVLLLALATAAGLAVAQDVSVGWPSYGGDAGNTRVRLTQITPRNVDRLAIAWEYHTGDVSDGGGATSATSFRPRPFFSTTRFICVRHSAGCRARARHGQATLDVRPESTFTGQRDARPMARRCAAVCRLGRFPGDNRPRMRQAIRGVIDGRLIALDATTGKPCADFGKDGTIDINALPNLGAGQVNFSSPPAIFEDLVIGGSAIGDNVAANMPHGFVRAFDARTGKLVWSWDPIPSALADKTGAGNVWAPISVDRSAASSCCRRRAPARLFGGERIAEMPYATPWSR